MTLKSAAKRGVQALLFSRPVYALMRHRAASHKPLSAPDACERLEKVSPRPRHARADLSSLPASEVDVSVIVPVYNVERYVGACLTSILSQDVPATMEVIAVIDGSPDGSEAIARDLAAKDARLRVIVQDNQGLSGARNMGIALARGRWIAFVDSDDMLAPGYLAALVERMRVGGCDIVGSLWTRMSEDGTVLGLGERERTHMAPWGRLYDRRVWEHVRFPVGCWYEDLITPCCIQPLFREAFIDEAGYLYRSRPGSIVEDSSSNPKALDAFWALDEMLGWGHELGIVYGQQDWDRLVWIMGPLLMGRTTFLDDAARRALFSVLCDVVASLDELADVRTTLPGCWRDIELALRGRHYELWCLACAALARGSQSIKMVTAWSIYRQACAGSSVQH